MNERRRLEREIASAAEKERRRLGLEIHDGVCQQITGALVRCEALARRLNRREALAAGDLAALSSLLEDAIDEAHAVARGLCPLEPDPGALAVALRALARKTQLTTGVTCRFAAAGDVRAADPMAAQHFYRIAQEAVSNAVRHAYCNTIQVSLDGTAAGFLLQIEDNGRGLSEAASVTGMGLRTMSYRARLLEGEFNVAPAPSGGTLITCRLPCAAFLRPGEGSDLYREADDGY